MRAVEFLAEYNVANLNVLDTELKKILKSIPNKEIADKIFKKLRKFVINNNDFLIPVTKIPTNAPEWAKTALANKDLYNFKMSPAYAAKFHHLAHYIESLLKDVASQPSQTNPNFTLLNQQHLEANRILSQLDKVSLPDLITKSNDYYKTGSNKVTKSAEGMEQIVDAGGGWKWYKLITQDAFEREGKVLQNCIGEHYTEKSTKGRWNILVLKDPANNSHVAARTGFKTNELVELQGKNNKPPALQYLGYCAELISNLKLKVDQNIQSQFIDESGYIYNTDTNKFESVSDAYKSMIDRELDIPDMPEVYLLKNTTFTSSLVNRLFNGYSYFRSRKDIEYRFLVTDNFNDIANKKTKKLMLTYKAGRFIDTEQYDDRFDKTSVPKYSLDEIKKFKKDILANMNLTTKARSKKGVFVPGSNFHEMLKYIGAHPGEPRSGWYHKHLGLNPAGMPGFDQDKALDGMAFRLKLITRQDKGKWPYQLRLTVIGRRLLNMLDAGEEVSVDDIDNLYENKRINRN